MWCFSLISPRRSGVAVPFASATARSSKKPTMAPGLNGFLGAHDEGMRDVRGHVHEAAGYAELLALFDVHQVGALQDVERLRRVAMDVQWWTEPGWFCLGLEHGERSGRRRRIGKHDSFEVPEVEQTTLTWLNNEGLRHAGQ